MLGAASTARAGLPVRIVRLACGLVIGCAINGFAPQRAAAQVPFSPFRPVRQMEAAKPLARDVTGPPAASQRLDGTAFFVDDLGHMLTARHAVADCARIVVSKEGRAVAARVVALAASDIALIKVPRTLGLAAVFPRANTSVANDMVFAEAYDRLKPMLVHGGSLGNAFVDTTLRDPEHLVLRSNVTFGTSGAPVLDSRGLVEGVVSRRTTVDRVLAVDAVHAKSFLAAHGVRFQEDDRPQMSGTASRAHRAASISARVTCLQQ
ncbi:S1 family peptidase [Bradyrhizobium erythrophlei]|uniref:Trypsin-like peptidase domain-containing protein n=1 Tax=Bradyrhizobium erythrophlei TaxID=1437360 RepID=A0A1H5GZY7_9BRAD|nr:serine protease [Bradyrhizobium erythrophlei]SEE21210.1 Trypsin-like peptidase domain-containing protein [Bradyrhizobium erythrophlei]